MRYFVFGFVSTIALLIGIDKIVLMREKRED